MTSPPEPSALRQGSTMMTCSKCGRVNHPEARFCDWCGAKVRKHICLLTCIERVFCKSFCYELSFGYSSVIVLVYSIRQR